MGRKNTKQRPKLTWKCLLLFKNNSQVPFCFLISSRTRMKILKCGRISNRMKAKKHWKHSLKISSLISRTKRFIVSLYHLCYIDTLINKSYRPLWGHLVPHLGSDFVLLFPVVFWDEASLSVPQWLLSIPRGRTGKYLGFFSYTFTLAYSQSTYHLCFEPHVG